MTNSLPKILITGSDGQIGQALQRHTDAALFALIACSRTTLDITNKISIQEALDTYQPNLIINTAAYTAVDKAQQEPDLAQHINAQGAALLAQACQEHNIPLIHLSTDYVFDGHKDTPYLETDTTHPINIYGTTKLLGEQAIRQYCEQHLILRVSSVFSEHGHNFLKTMLRLAREKETLRVVADQIACPTYAGHIAGVIYTLIRRFQPGTYHYCDKTAVTWHEFASAIIAAAAEQEPLMVKEVLPITTTDYPTPANRPAYSVLDCQHLEQTFAIKQADWRISLPIVLQQLKGLPS